MKSIKFHALVPVLAFFFAASGQDTIYLHENDKWQDSLNARAFLPTVFIIDSGIHRLHDLLPWHDQTFVGKPGAIMSGARLCSSWVYDSSAGLWSAGGQIQEGRVFGVCEPPYPACAYPEDMFADDSMLTRVLSIDSVGPGRWYFDYQTDSVFIADDPRGHVIEVGSSERAFGGTGSQITIKNLVIEKYACPTQEGAITNQWPGDNWHIENCEMRFNHSTAIQLRGRNCIVRGNKIHHNGQKGLGIVDGGDSSIIENNEFAYNNWRRAFSFGWEGGGAKFVYARNLKIRNNHAHHNIGAGLWTDIGCTNILYEHNRCEYNAAEGIFHEISDSAIIRCNILRFNASIIGANLQLGNSSNTQVYGNVIDVHPDYGDGLIVVQNDRTDMNSGMRFSTRNNIVHHNQIIYRADRGISGGYCEYDCDAYWTDSTIRFDYNAYHAPSAGQARWGWSGTGMTWEQFQAAGFEANGSTDTDTSSIDSIANCASFAPVRMCGDPASRRFFGKASYIALEQRICVTMPDYHGESVVCLYDAHGRRMMRQTYVSAHAEKEYIDARGLSSGAYFVRLHAGLHDMRQKITIMR